MPNTPDTPAGPGSASAGAQIGALLGFGAQEILETRVGAVIEARNWRVIGRFVTQPELLRAAARGDASVAFYCRALTYYSDSLIEELLALGVRPVEITGQLAPLISTNETLGAMSMTISIGSIDEGIDTLERQDITPLDLSAAAEAVHDVIGSPDQPIVGNPAPIIMVTSGKDGPGKTTVALGLAAALGRMMGPERVVLADFDVRGGNVSPWLGLDQSRGLIASIHPGRDAPERAATELEATPWFLALAGLERGGQIDPSTIERSLRALARDASGGLIVCDAASSAQPAALQQRAAIAVVVIGPDLLGAWNAAPLVNTLLSARQSIVLAVNRWNPRDAAAASLADLADAVGIRRSSGFHHVVGMPALRDTTPLQLNHIAPGADGGTDARAFAVLAEATLLTLNTLDSTSGWAEHIPDAESGGRLSRLRRRRDNDMPTRPPSAVTNLAAAMPSRHEPTASSDAPATDASSSPDVTLTPVHTNQSRWRFRMPWHHDKDDADTPQSAAADMDNRAAASPPETTSAPNDTPEGDAATLVTLATERAAIDAEATPAMDHTTAATSAEDSSTATDMSSADPRDPVETDEQGEPTASSDAPATDASSSPDVTLTPVHTNQSRWRLRMPWHHDKDDADTPQSAAADMDDTTAAASAEDSSTATDMSSADPRDPVETDEQGDLTASSDAPSDTGQQDEPTATSDAPSDTGQQDEPTATSDAPSDTGQQDEPTATSDAPSDTGQQDEPTATSDAPSDTGQQDEPTATSDAPSDTGQQDEPTATSDAPSDTGQQDEPTATSDAPSDTGQQDEPTATSDAPSDTGQQDEPTATSDAPSDTGQQDEPTADIPANEGNAVVPSIATRTDTNGHVPHDPDVATEPTPETPGAGKPVPPASPPAERWWRRRKPAPSNADDGAHDDSSPPDADDGAHDDPNPPNTREWIPAERYGNYPRDPKE